MNTNYVYRYWNYSTSSGEHLALEELRIVSTTKNGVWVMVGFNKKKFINLKAKKQYACLTKEEAYLSYQARKRRQIAILQANLEKAIQASTLTIITKENK